MPLWTLQNSIHIADIIKLHSYLGKVKVAFLFSGFEGVIKKNQFLFIAINQKPVPFFIEEINFIADETAIIKFKNIDNEQQAAELIGKKLIADETKIPTKLLETIKDDDVIGYTIYTADNTLIGTITDIMDNSAHELLLVEREDKSELYIPYLDDFIIDIDDINKIIKVQLPDGYLEI